MYYPRIPRKKGHSIVKVSKRSVLNLLRAAARFAFPSKYPDFSFHQTLTFPVAVTDAPAAKSVLNQYLNCLFKVFGKYDLAAFYMTERRKKSEIHYHVIFCFFNSDNLPFAPSRMERDFRTASFQRWNSVNQGACIHDANALAPRRFDLKTIQYFVKTLRIPKHPQNRPETINWGIRGKSTLDKYAPEQPPEMAEQLFDKLFAESARSRSVNPSPNRTPKFNCYRIRKDPVPSRYDQNTLEITEDFTSNLISEIENGAIAPEQPNEFHSFKSPQIRKSHWRRFDYPPAPSCKRDKQIHPGSNNSEPLPFYRARDCLMNGI
jgi:hypothetical protein